MRKIFNSLSCNAFIRSLCLTAIVMALSVGMLTAAPNESGEKSEVKGATKKERNLILDGNQLYREKKFQQAVEKYRLALKSNPESNVAPFNIALSDIHIAASVKDNDSIAGGYMRQAAELLQQVGSKNDRRNNISAKAWYNLGNISFYGEDYGQAIAQYKEALRLNPSDNNARRNLRIAQKKKQNQDKNNKQNQQNQDKNEQDQKDKQKDKQNQNQQNQNNQTPPPKLDKQTSDQILNAIERKENQTRMKVNANPEEQTPRAGRSNKNW